MSWNFLKERIKALSDMEEEYFIVKSLDGEINRLTPISFKKWEELENKHRGKMKCKFKKYTFYKELKTL